MTGTAEPVEAALAATAAAAFAAYRDGSAGELDVLVKVVTPILWHTARSCGLDAQTAQDAVQTTWLALVRSRDSIKQPVAVLQWLIVTVRRESWRLANAQRKVDPVDFADFEPMAPPADAPEPSVLRTAAERSLWRHVSQLSARCQQLLRVIAFADKPDYAAVSRALGMPVGSIGPTRGRCLAQLRAALAAESAE